MSTLKKSLLAIVSVIILFFVVHFINVYYNTIHSLDGIKKMYVESLIFEENPDKLKQFKRTEYYRNMMNAKTSDSVRYYYKQFIINSGEAK